ncbi:response regulator RpfG family c-di-GMP phosphodiesterase [Methylobacter tundripaludum]|uniref:Response regulator RpfG family c-di-GMP phosphodiesterase n=1 Tax=Methylobacter tundripaludum TaxID=173365 RepID=A0A2S6HD39_9GAMM|nr:HD domain-containing phosphohydrolase [Methylobacter tundripaludum]PPK75378.1 response regulator RpfG family c-di-GMP phosphodiesterase [Methylobacter tundripaludum]
MLIDPASDTPDKSAAILFVDDEANVLKALRRLFHNEPYTAYFASSGAEGLEILRQNAVDLIISDMRMPEMSGAEFLAQVFMQWPETIRILLTGYADFQSTIDAVNKGRIYNYCNKPWNDEELKLLVRNALEQKHLREERDRLSGIVLQQNTELKELNEHLEEKVEQRTEQLKNTMQHLDRANNNLKKQYIDSIKAFSRIIEMRPGIKSGQSKYIAEKALLVARKLGMNTEEKQNIFYAGLLIQIGKMSLQDSLLAEPYYSIPLIDIRRYLKHAVEGEALLKGLTQLKGASILIRHQYERYDGSGFPDGLAKQKIPLGSRILNVVGDYIAYLEGSMTGEVMSVSATINQLMSRKESYYDPDVIDTFIKVLKEDTSIEEDVVVEPPTLEKSWKNSRLLGGSQNTAMERPVMEISWTQLKPGMEIESVHFENKPYIKNCIVDQKIINNINSLRENTGKNPVIKIRMGKK